MLICHIHLIELNKNTTQYIMIEKKQSYEKNMYITVCKHLKEFSKMFVSIVFYLLWKKIY